MRRKKEKQYCFFVSVVLLLSVLLFGCMKKEPVALKETKMKEKQTNQETRKTKEPKTIMVDVCGAVNIPGVYELPMGSRLFEAVKKAGGMTEVAASAYLNQAVVLKDGEQIYVPTTEEAVKNEAPSEEGLQGDTGKSGQVNLNTASKEELMTLTGIGEAKAESIIAYRKEHGGFQTTDELKQIPGIKDAIFNKMKEQITIK
ncbi:MAG: helix-hairpin-helix domain-containing protein [Lachnospiraceae bacterium]